MLTLVTTKWETLKLSLYRLITFGVTVVLAGITIGCDGKRMGGIRDLCITSHRCLPFAGMAGDHIGKLRNRTHFLMTEDFGLGFIFNEFLLVLIGISIAVVLNLFYDYRHQKNGLISGMRYTEQQLQKVLGELAEYLTGRRCRAVCGTMSAGWKERSRSSCGTPANIRTIHSSRIPGTISIILR